MLGLAVAKRPARRMPPISSEPPSSSPGPGRVGVFFALTFLLTAPLWVLSGASGLSLMPGLPIAGLAVVCPALAAVILTWRASGRARALVLLRRVFDAGRTPGAAPWLAVLLISPAAAVSAFLIGRLGGAAIPDPVFTLSGSLVLFAIFLVGGLAEELGWSGFALDPLQARWGPLPAALAIGAVWSVWHYPALIQADRSVVWIAWWTLGTMALRVVMVWVFNITRGSVFAVAVLHAMSNLCWQLFPIRGSWFDPRVHGLLMAGVAIAVILAGQGRAHRAAAQARLSP